MVIYPAILTDNKEKLKEMIKTASEFCNNVHLDVMDGRFVRAKSISFNDLIETSLSIEVHLMVIDPINYIQGFKEKGAFRIIFHLESENNPKDVIKKIKDHNLSVGIAINPETEIEKILPYIDNIDMVLLMSVNPGFYGSKFIPKVLDKVKAIKGKNVLIAMDGGIKSSNIRIIKESGVEIADVGSEIFLSEDPKAAFERLCKI